MNRLKLGCGISESTAFILEIKTNIHVLNFALRQEMLMTDHRKVERVKAMIFTAVYELQGHVLLGFLGDLTLQGAMVVGEKPLGVNRNTTLSIEFRGATEVPGGRLIIPAHAAWCRLEKESAYYHSGFKFLEMTDQNTKTIEALLERYKFNSDISS